MPPDKWGFLKVSRKLFSSSLWLELETDESFCKRAAFIDLLARAAFAERVQLYKGRAIRLEPGEFLAPSRALARRWGWHHSTVVRWLQRLEDRGTLSSRPAWTGPRYSPRVYRFEKWEQYQGATEETQAAQGSPREGATVQEELPEPAPGGATEESDRKTPSATTPEADTVRQRGETERTKIATEKPQQPQGKTPEGETGREEGNYKKKNTYLSTWSLIQDGPAPPPFEAVAHLAELAAHFGQDNGRHRGLNIKILNTLIRKGASPSTIAHQIRGARLLADSGAVPWIQPRAPFALGALFGQTRFLEDRHLAAVAYDASRAQPLRPAQPPSPELLQALAGQDPTARRP